MEVERFNNQSLPEEIFNSITHGVGAVIAAVGTTCLIVYACLNNDVISIVSGSIYGFSLIFLFTMSSLYHAFTNHKVKRVFQVLDHCSIFLLILGTYTPMCLIVLQGAPGWALWGFNAVFAVLGITLNAVNLKRWHRLSLIFYVLMGWSVVFVVSPLFSLVGLQGILLLLAGGLCYTIGIIFYRAKKPRFMHSVWHLLVLGGAIIHYFFILFYIFL
jgi:hemolysin III